MTSTLPRFPSPRSPFGWAWLLLALLPILAHAQSASDFTYSKSSNQLTITGYTGSVTDVVIPGSIHGIAVTAIGDSAFAKGGVTSAVIPNGVTTIGNNAFEFCQSLGRVTIPKSVTVIGNEAFEDCTSLRAATLPNGVTVIGNYAFYVCASLPSVTIPESVTFIGSSAFVICPVLTSITVSAHNPAYSSVNGVLFDKSRTTLLQYPGGKTGPCAVPGGVTTIGPSAFLGTKVTSVTLPASLTTIGASAFNICTILSSVTIPSGVTALGADAFGDCAKLRGATFLGNAPSLGSNAFNGAASDFKVYFYNGATGFTAPKWTDSSGNRHNSVNLGAKPVPAITSGSATGFYKTPFSYTIPATRSPTAFRAAGLPTGLSLDSTKGIISGTPATVGAFKITLAAINAFGTGKGTLSLTLGKASQKITFPAIAEQTYLGSPLTLEASASSTLPVTYTVTSSPATLSGKNLTFTGTGAVTVKASQAGNAHYLAAADVSESFPIKPAAQEITFPAVTSATVGQTITLTATSNSGLPISYSIIPTSGYDGKAKISGSKLAFTGPGKIKLAADQPGNANYLPAEQVRENVIILAAH